jgi:hypothetical protein
MPEIIDKEIERVAKLGHTPKTIYVGTGLYNEIRNEQFAPFAADSVTDRQEGSSFPTEEPTEYKGIKIHVVEDEEPDYLSIET